MHKRKSGMSNNYKIICFINHGIPKRSDVYTQGKTINFYQHNYHQQNRFIRMKKAEL